MVDHEVKKYDLLRCHHQSIEVGTARDGILTPKKNCQLAGFAMISTGVPDNEGTELSDMVLAYIGMNPCVGERHWGIQRVLSEDGRFTADQEISSRALVLGTSGAGCALTKPWATRKDRNIEGPDG